MTINTWLNVARSPSDSGSQNQLTHRVVAEPGATGAPMPVSDGYAAVAPASSAPRAVTPQQALRRPASPVTSDDGSEDDGSCDMSDGFDEASIGGYSDFEFESHDRDADAIREQVQAAVQMLGADARISHFGREIEIHLPWETMP